MGVDNTDGLQVVSYKLDVQGELIEFATNQPFTNSSHIVVVWDFLAVEDHAHSYSNWKSIASETCITAEVLERECTSPNCGYKETKPGREALGHNEQASIVAPQKNSAGYTLHKCKRAGCNYEYKDNYKYLISYVSISENNTVDSTDLPVIEEQIYNQNQKFMGIENTNKYFVLEYRHYINSSNYINFVKGDKFNYSMELTIVWERVDVNHKHSYSQTVVNPTESQAGYTLHECECGDSYKDSYKYLLSFVSQTNNPGINKDDLPQIENITINDGEEFEGVLDTSEFL